MNKRCKCGSPGPFRTGRSVCRKCESKNNVAHAQKYPERKRALNKKFFKTQKGKTAIFRKTRVFRLTHPEKYSAHKIVQSAIRNGSLVRGICEKCSAPKAHAHHDDYSKPLTVRWLCDHCHVDHHTGLLAERSKPG